MKVKVAIYNKGKVSESCEVYEHYGDEVTVEVTEQKEPDVGEPNS